MGTLILTPTAVTEAGMSRLRVLVARYGIQSNEVLQAVYRWGQILDDVTAGDQGE